MTSLIIRIVILVSYTLGNAAMLLVDGTANYPLYCAMRSIGQMALPLVCFLLVEGFYRTSNKKFYFIRLFAFGSAAFVPFWYMSMQGMRIVEDAIHTYIGADAVCNAENLALLKPLVDENAFAYYYDIFLYTSTAAVDGMMTIAMNLLMLFVIDAIKKKYFGVKKAPYIILTTLAMLGTMFVLIIIPFEEPILITLMVAMFYFLRGNKPAISIMMMLAIVSFYTGITLAYAIGAILAVLLIYTYNGKEGSKKFRYVFYAYYPLHMIVLYYLSTLL